MKQYCILYIHNGLRYAEYVTFHHQCKTCRRFELRRKHKQLSRIYGRAQLVFYFKKGDTASEIVGVCIQCDAVTQEADPAPKPTARRLKLKPYDLMPAQMLNNVGASSVETIALEESDSELSIDGSMASMNVNCPWW